MRLLISSTYYAPEPAGNAPYVTGVAEHFAARGHEVRVVCGFPHYPSWRQHGRKLAERTTLHGVDVIRRRHYVPRCQSAFSRAVYEASLVTSGLTALGGFRPDAVLAVVPSLASGFLGSLVAAACERPLGVVFQDLMGRAASQSGVEGGRRIASYVQRAELSLARRADGVGIVADGFAPYLEAGGVTPAKITRLRNWTRSVEPSVPRASVRAAHGWPDGRLVVLHAGNMGRKQGLENVLGAARRLRAANILFVFAGDGNERDAVERAARRLELSNVSFLPPQAPGDYEALLGAADILLVNQRGSVGDMSLPSKLTSYYAAARPIVGAVARGSETEREINGSRAGVVVPADSPDALAEAVRHLAQHPALREELGRRGTAYVASALAPARALAAYEAFVYRLLFEPGSRRVVTAPQALRSR